MVLDMARPKYKKSTIWRCCKKVDSQGEHFTGIHDRFSEIQFIVNHNSQSDGQNKSAKRWTNSQKKTIHFISLQRNRKYQRQWYLTLNRSGKNGPMKLRSDSLSKIVYTASQAKKLKSLFIQNNIGDGIPLQGHNGGTSLNGIGNELIRFF